METPLILWAAFALVITALLIFDLGFWHKDNKHLSLKDALKLSAFYIFISILFGLGVWHFDSPQAGYEFFTGYLIEKSLSVDNVFVFCLIFTHFSVPEKYQHRVLYWGILGALIMRGIMIFVGSALITKFTFLFYIFGGFLIFTGIKMLFAADAEPDLENNKLLRFLQNKLRVSKEFEGDKFFTKINNKFFFTPLFLVLVLVEISDVIFAVDSIPAIFAITQDPFVIFTSNIFAILGLRALYFALAAIIHRFSFLKYGLSLILVFIGSKMIINHWFGEKVISTELSLGLVFLTLFLSLFLSLKLTAKQEKPEVKGWVPGSPAKQPDEKIK